jgi:cytochrome oxidase assembly protein ShyY1
VAGTAPGRVEVQFRQVVATGTYDGAHQSLLRNQTINGDTGYLVVTPLRTGDATLLVVRGFVTGPSRSITAPAPPSGRVTVTARVWPSNTKPDDGAKLANGQVESINAADQARRLGTPVLDGFAYVIQWFLFAALALAAPVVMVRAEAGHSSRQLDDDSAPKALQPADDAHAAKLAKLADRYGRTQHKPVR